MEETHLKKGLVLEGGAMRGLFTAGILDVLMEENIEFDGVIGVSAGACFGCNYKSKQIGRTLRYNLKYCKDPRMSGFRSLLFTGDIYGAEFCYRTIPKELDIFDTETFTNSPVEFHVVATDVLTGKPVYHKCTDGGDNDLDWIRASASMPLVSRIVEAEGKYMLDGGISDSIPLKYYQNIGYDRNLVILTRPQDYVKGENKLLPLMRMQLRKYPNLINTMANRHTNYNETIHYIREEEKKGTTFVICPDEELPISRIEHDPERIQNVYDIGRQTAIKHLDSIKSFLEPVK